MASNEEDSVVNLRKKSHEVLNHLEKNSEVIKKELQQLKLQSSSRTLASNQHACKSVNDCISDTQKAHNDSSKVSGLDYSVYKQSLNQKSQDQEDMTVGGRILITSKKPVEVEPLKKPVKGCYCHDQKKIQFKSPEATNKPMWPCDYCKSHFDVQLPDTEETSDVGPSSVLSCNTLRKVQEINYTPKSEFLRRVQQKASQNSNICKSCSEPTVKPSQYAHERVDDPLDAIEVYPENVDEVKHKESNRNSRPRSRKNGSEKRSPEIETIFTANTSTQPTSSKVLTKKTISSSKLVSENVCRREADDNQKETGSKNKLKSRTLTQQSCQNDCCSVNARSKSPKKNKKTGQETCLQCHQCPHRCPSQFLDTGSCNKEDEKVIKLRKFREKNYYDTHGSKSTLFGSLDPSVRFQEYQLNERLFPVTTGKIDDDAVKVVTLPPCATKPFKKVHYFPKFIVKQDERAAAFPKCKDKGYRPCPLTGHAIDVRNLKIPEPFAESMALRYQKRRD